ncbi:MAG: alpha/beta hydrolase [Acidimicrobiales bacterium]
MDQNSTSASTTETSDHPGVDVTAERSTDAGRRWSRRRRALVFVAVVLCVFYGIVSWTFSGMILYNSGGEYSEEREAREIAALELDSIDDPEHFTVESSGVPIAGSFYENPAETGCAVLFLHGRGGQRTELIDYVPLFWDRGCHAIVYDLRSRGDSGGDVQSFGALDRLDTAAVIEWVADRTGLTSSDIGLFGASYGAGTALVTTTVVDDLAFVIADSSYSSISAAVSEHAARDFSPAAVPFVPGAVWLAGWRGGFAPEDSSPKNAAAQTDTPLLLIHPLDDTTNEWTHSQEIYDSADPTTTRLTITDWGNDHVGSYRADPAAYSELVNEFLDELAPNWPSL